jgi:hypothetical protein
LGGDAYLVRVSGGSGGLIGFAALGWRVIDLRELAPNGRNQRGVFLRPDSGFQRLMGWRGFGSGTVQNLVEGRTASGHP